MLSIAVYRDISRDKDNTVPHGALSARFKVTKTIFTSDIQEINIQLRHHKIDDVQINDTDLI